MATEDLHKFRDSLTGFHTREALFEYLFNLVTNAQTHQKTFSLLMLDIDHFKLINDRFGHPNGDDALKFFAGIINEVLKGEHFVARYGGDEFIIVMNTGGQKDAVEIAKRIRALLNKRFYICKGRPILMKTSFGIAFFPQDANKQTDLIKRADEALYFGKKHGRNKIILASKIRFLPGTIKNIKLKYIALLLIVILSAYLFKTHYNKLFDLKGIYGTSIIRFNYQLHKLRYGYNFCSLELDDGSKVSGWIARQDKDKLYITLKYPDSQVMEIPKKRIKIFIKIKK